jgi:hypothetical protein
MPTNRDMMTVIYKMPKIASRVAAERAQSDTGKISP